MYAWILMQQRCNIFAVDAALWRARNGRMKIDANRPGSLLARCADHLPGDLRQAAEDRESGEMLKTAKRLKTVKPPKRVKTWNAGRTARPLNQEAATPSGAPLTLPRWRAGPSLSRKREREFNARLRLPLPFTGESWGEGRADAPMPETLKHETPASCRRAETVKHPTAQGRGAAMCKARETVKQRGAVQPRETLKHREPVYMNQRVICFTPVPSRAEAGDRP